MSGGYCQVTMQTRPVSANHAARGRVSSFLPPLLPPRATRHLAGTYPAFNSAVTSWNEPLTRPRTSLSGRYSRGVPGYPPSERPETRPACADVRVKGRRGPISTMTQYPETPETTESPERPTAADRTESELDELADVLDSVIEEGERKLTGEGRIRDATKEKCRIKWANAVVRAAKARQQVIKNRDLAEMHKEIEKLKQQREGWR